MNLGILSVKIFVIFFVFLSFFIVFAKPFKLYTERFLKLFIKLWRPENFMLLFVFVGIIVLASYYICLHSGGVIVEGCGCVHFDKVNCSNDSENKFGSVYLPVPGCSAMVDFNEIKNDSVWLNNLCYY